MEKRGWRLCERRRDKRVKGEGEGRKTAPPKKKKIFLVQLNGVSAPLCKGKRLVIA